MKHAKGREPVASIDGAACPPTRVRAESMVLFRVEVVWYFHVWRFQEVRQ